MSLLRTVTITGADDKTDVNDLLALSRRYPFVEWAILIGSQDGTPRFPTNNWIRNLADLNAAKSSDPHVPAMSLSLHVCGKYLRRIAEGRPKFDELTPFLRQFQRVQLNWHGTDVGPIGGKLQDAFVLLAAGLWSPCVIFQMDGVNDGLITSLDGLLACHGLFDTSHGAGVLPDSWPARKPNYYCGWAGGLGPDNLELALPRIHEAAAGEPYWVDMETRVRTDDDARLDLGKVEQCLKIAEQFMQEHPV